MISLTYQNSFNFHKIFPNDNSQLCSHDGHCIASLLDLIELDFVNLIDLLLQCKMQQKQLTFAFQNSNKILKSDKEETKIAVLMSDSLYLWRHIDVLSPEPF